MSTHEKRDANVSALFWLAALLVVAGIVALLAAGGWVRFLARERAASEQIAEPMAHHGPANFPEPRLQISPPEDLAKLRAREERELSTYGWIVRDQGLVRLPVERAIDLLTQRGLPEAGAGRTEVQFMQNVPGQKKEPQ